jgi:HKD family nuclease
MLKPGLYEQVINKELGRELDQATDQLKSVAPIDTAEASKVLAKYITEIIEKGLDNVKDNGGDIQTQIDLANKLVQTIISETKDATFDALSVDQRAEQLLALINKQNTVYAVNEKAEIIRPKTSIAQSSLFTGAIHEPSMFTELKKEIVSADRIDMLVSFIKWSGLRLIIDELRSFAQRGGQLRIITTSYMGATDVKAIEELRQLHNTEIKVSYDTKRTRLHAKTYVFYRDTGFTTAYVGSSNLSNAANSSGLEWNVKVTAKDLPETIRKIDATFESYWNPPEFEAYSEDQKTRLAQALNAEKYTGEDSYRRVFLLYLNNISCVCGKIQKYILYITNMKYI